jgi:hypothetical protein
MKSTRAEVNVSEMFIQASKIRCTISFHNLVVSNCPIQFSHYLYPFEIGNHTKIGVEFDIKLGEKYLPQIVQADVDIPT